MNRVVNRFFGWKQNKVVNRYDFEKRNRQIFNVILYWPLAGGDPLVRVCVCVRTVRKSVRYPCARCMSCGCNFHSLGCVCAMSASLSPIDMPYQSSGAFYIRAQWTRRQGRCVPTNGASSSPEKKNNNKHNKTQITPKHNTHAHFLPRKANDFHAAAPLSHLPANVLPS